MICFLANIKVYLEGKLMRRKPVKFTYRILTWLRFKSCSLNRRISKVNYLLEFCLTGAAPPFVDVKCWPLAARPKAVLAGSRRYILLVAEPSLAVPRKNLLAKAFMKLMFWNPQENRSPPCSVGTATVKLVSSMAPPTSPRTGGSVPISLPHHIFSLGAQHILPVCLRSFCSALLIIHMFKPLVFYSNYGVSLNCWVSCKGDLLLQVIFPSPSFCLCDE